MPPTSPLEGQPTSQPTEPRLPDPRLSITSAFESGNIDVLAADDPQNIRLAIRPDPYCKSDKQQHYQWFYFAVSGAEGVPLVLHLTNAGGASYPEAWPGSAAVASSDLVTWSRIDTAWCPETGTLTLRHTPSTHHVRYAYFAPYTNQQVDALVAGLAGAPGIHLTTLPPSGEGRPLYLLQCGGCNGAGEGQGGPAAAPTASSPNETPCVDHLLADSPSPLRIWVLARQHPGEPQGSWFVDGMLRTLSAAVSSTTRGATNGGEELPLAAGGGQGLAKALEAAQVLLREAVVYVVPNMCPDGVARGHLRTNASGANLNREWALPGDPTLAPEVAGVRAAMSGVGVDLLLDVHGDEEVPAVFVSGLEGLASWGPLLHTLQDAFKDAMCAASPYFQSRLGYPTPPPHSANLAVCSKAVAAQWDTLALTLEMPFKELTEPVKVDWTPERCAELGQQSINALVALLPLLRAHKGMAAAAAAASGTGEEIN